MAEGQSSPPTVTSVVGDLPLESHGFCDDQLLESQCLDQLPHHHPPTSSPPLSQSLPPTPSYHD